MGIWTIMSKFITKTSFSINLDQIKNDLEQLLLVNPWPETDFHKQLPGNQLGVTYRPGAENRWLDASGSLYDKNLQKFIGKESDFTEYNEHLPCYTRGAIEQLAACENTQFGRIRFMQLMPKTGLSVHPDFEHRYHLALVTNKYAYFGEHINAINVSAKCYHIPSDGYFYKVDTTRDHFVYNGGWEPRIHLVLCEAK